MIQMSEPLPAPGQEGGQEGGKEGVIVGSV